MNIGDIFFSLRGDGGLLQVDAQKAAEAAGIKAGQSFGSKLKSAAGGAIGAGIGAGFVGAVQAGVAFEDQLRTINTVAKLTDDELFKIGDDIQALSRETGKSTDDLTSGVYDLVSAGVPADKAIASLRASAILATGALGSTGEAVDLVTSALGAYKLDASETTRVTDIFAQAVADGKTTVAALAGGISQVAPIAAAAGVSLEEVAAGTALMTLSGDTASQAMVRIKATLSALLTPNRTLNELTAKTGINWANMARERGLAVTLEELRKATQGNNEEFAKALGSSEALTFAFSVTGDNAGAMAAELDKVTKAGTEGGVALEQYAEKSKSGAEASKRLAAWLKTLSQDFGGLFAIAGPVIQLFGPTLGRAIGAGLGGVAGILIPKVVAAVAATGIPAAIAGTGVGTAVGAAMGAAIPFALVAAAGVGIGLAFKKIFLDPDLEKQTKAIAASVSDQLVTGTLDELRQSKSALEKGIADLNALPFGGFLAADQITGLQKDLDAVDAAIAAKAAEIPASVADEVTAGTPKVEVAIADLVSTFGTSMSGIVEASRATGADGMAAMAAGVKSARQKPLDAFDTLVEMLKHAMTPAAEAARLAGELTSKQLAAGLKSADPEVRAQALAVKQAILDRLAELGQADDLGQEAMAQLEKGLRSKDPEIRAAAESMKAIVEEKLNGIKAKEAAAKAAAEYAAYWAGGEGKAKIQGALGTVTSVIQGLLGGAGSAAATPRPIRGFAAGTPFVERTGLALIHRGEAIIPADQNQNSAGGQTTVNVYNPTPEPASTSVSRELQSLAFLGAAS